MTTCSNRTVARTGHALPLMLLLGLAACASAPMPAQPPAQSLATATPAQMVEYIHAAAGDGEDPDRSGMTDSPRRMAQHQRFLYTLM